MRLNEAFTTPETKRRYVRRLFGTIAGRYDLITVLLSFGRDRAWKKRLIDLSGARAGLRVLDLACGTGDLAFDAARRGARVVGVDFAWPMLQLAAAKQRRGTVTFVQADMTALPMTASSFDIVTTGYGLRNVPDLPDAIAEIHRALRSGGIFCSLDFNRPERRWLRFVYLTYLACVGSALGWVLHRDPDTYRYIPASLRRYPGAQGVASLLRAAGFTDVRVVPVFGGFMTIHVARKRSDA